MVSLANILMAKLDEQAAELETSERIRIEAMARSLKRRAQLMLAGWIDMLARLVEQAESGFVEWFSIEHQFGREFDFGMHSHWVDPSMPLAGAVLAPADGVVITSATLKDRPPTAPEDWEHDAANGKHDAAWQAVQNRIALGAPALFGHIVNSNLEVRTSVSIDPHTGAAEDGALFTYEALPRSTFLTAEVVLDDYRLENKIRPFPREKTDKGNPLPHGPWADPLDVVKAGFKMMEHLGVGGMGTRGFGRLAPIGKLPKVDLRKEAVQEAA